MGQLVSHAQLQAYRALRGDPDIPVLQEILRALAADRRVVVSEAVAILRGARDQVAFFTVAAEIDRIIAELEAATEKSGSQP
jgi:hypothetical protein